MAEFVQAQMIPIFPMRILIEGSQIDNKLTTIIRELEIQHHEDQLRPAQ